MKGFVRMRRMIIPKQRTQVRYAGTGRSHVWPWPLLCLSFESRTSIVLKNGNWQWTSEVLPVV